MKKISSLEPSTSISRLLLPAVLLFLSACSQGVFPTVSTIRVLETATATQAEAAQVVPTAQPVLLESPTPTKQLVDTPTPAPTVRAPLACSPLEGISIAELLQPDLLKNPFQPPRPGMDDGHHGVDFAYWSRGERTTMLGLPVLSALTGRIAGIIENSQPYGNAIIIETNLDFIPAEAMKQLALPVPAPTIQPAANLLCPEIDNEQPIMDTGRSLYLLYAHLNQVPAGSIGQTVTCGQPIGEVGTTGKSVNPHLHFETRIGPSGRTFKEMAHYQNDATAEQMRNYCTWRVSGLFQLLDPLRLFQIDSLQP